MRGRARTIAMSGVSVRLSVTRWYWVKTNNRTIMWFSPSGSAWTLVFWGAKFRKGIHLATEKHRKCKVFRHHRRRVQESSSSHQCDRCMLLIARLCLQHLTVTVIDGDDNFPDCSHRPSYRINLTPLVLNIFFYFLPSADCWIYFYIWLFDCHFAQVTFVDGYCALQHSPPGCRLLSTTALNPLCRPNMSTSVDISTKRVKRLDRKLSYRWQVALSIIQQSFRSNTTVEMTSERYCYWFCTLYAVYLIYTQRNHL